MLEFFLLPENLPFSIALMLMLMIGAVEAIGLGIGAMDLDVAPEIEGTTPHLLGWLGVGRVPILILLVVILALFGMIGIGVQQLASGIIGAPLSPWLAAPVALAGALPLSGMAARALANIMPQDETTAIGRASLVGRRAVIVIGEARRGSPARGRVNDVHGQPHYVMIEPTADDEVLGTGATALLVRHENGIFYGLPDVNPLLSADDPPSTMINGGGLRA